MSNLMIDFDAAEKRYPLLHIDPTFCNISINHETQVVTVGVQGWQFNTTSFRVPSHLHADQISAIIEHFRSDFEKLNDLFFHNLYEYDQLYTALLQKFAALDLGIDLSSNQMITIADQLDYIDQADKTVDQIALELLAVERDSDCFYENEYDLDTIKHELFNIWSVQLALEGLQSLTPQQLAHVFDFAATRSSHEDALSIRIHNILCSAKDCSSAELVGYADAIAQAISSTSQLKAVHERAKTLQEKHLKAVKKLCKKYEQTDSGVYFAKMTAKEYTAYIVHDEAAQDLRELRNMSDQKFS